MADNTTNWFGREMMIIIIGFIIHYDQDLQIIPKKLSGAIYFYTAAIWDPFLTNLRHLWALLNSKAGLTCKDLEKK